MSIKPENTNPDELIPQALAGEPLNGSAATHSNDHNRDSNGNPLGLDEKLAKYREYKRNKRDAERAAANGANANRPEKVIVPHGFTRYPGCEVVSISFTLDEERSVGFLVVADILDDVKLSDFLAAEVQDIYPDFVPSGRFDKLDLKDYTTVGIYSVDEMQEEVEKMENCPYLLHNRIPRTSVNIMVGDSGIGKSPFSYELGMCIAAGVPFLGIPTTQGRVLYLDYEDDPALMISYARTIACKLKLSGVPAEFKLWSPAMDDNSNRNPLKLIPEYKPDFAIIDTLSTAFPLAEVENNHATELYKSCRATGAAVMFTHHLKKDSTAVEDSGWDLDLDRETTVKDFQSVRGAGALVNNAHLRMKLIRARANDEDWAFIVRSYRRGKGGMPTLSVGRVRDDNGDPIGHHVLGGLARLNPNYRKIFTDLPERFRFKDLTERGLKGGSRTQFIHACEAAKILSPDKDGDWYVKLPGWRGEPEG